MLDRQMVGFPKDDDLSGRNPRDLVLEASSTVGVAMSRRVCERGGGEHSRQEGEDLINRPPGDDDLDQMRLIAKQAGLNLSKIINVLGVKLDLPLGRVGLGVKVFDVTAHGRNADGQFVGLVVENPQQVGVIDEKASIGSGRKESPLSLQPWSIATLAMVESADSFYHEWLTELTPVGKGCEGTTAASGDRQCIVGGPGKGFHQAKPTGPDNAAF